MCNTLGRIIIGAAVLTSLACGRIATAAEPMVAGGYDHALYLADDGTVWAWGSNIYGQLGADPAQTSISRQPAKVAGLSNIVAVSAGYLYSLALTVDGKVYAWGYNFYGQLGRGTSGSSATMDWHPAAVSNLPARGIKAVVAGYYHALALDVSGQVWGWGMNSWGQLATGDYASPKSTAVAITTPSRVQALAAGYGHSLALSDSGTVMGWGLNGYGQLGDNTTINRPTVGAVSGLANIMSISAGYYHSVAESASGSGYSWGYNSCGQLGNGSYNDSPVPVSCGGAYGTRLIAFANSTLQLRCNSYISLWGDNAAGQCGSSKSTTKFSTMVSPGISCRAGMVGGFGSFVLLIALDGRVMVMGANTTGVFGNGSDSPSDSSTIQTVIANWPLSRIVSTAAGQYHGTAVKSDGTVWSWGYNANGQGGDGSADSYKLVPVQATGVSGAISVSAGSDYGDHTLALSGNGTVYGWGRNNYGETGDGTNLTPRTTPGSVALGGMPARAISAGDNHSLALDGYGTVRAWGADVSGELGDDTSYIDKYQPVAVSGLNNVVAVSAGGGSSGYGFSLALRSDGTVWSWGQGTSGQLGNGSLISHPTPVQVSGLSGVVAIAAGSYHALALRSDGSVWAWGVGNSGELGNGATSLSSTPVPVNAVAGTNRLADIRTIGAGVGFSYAVDGNGNVYAWGRGSNGQLGNGNTFTTNRPVADGWGNACTVEGGYISGTAALADGTVRCWGGGGSYQLGTGSPQGSPSPVQPLTSWLPYVAIDVGTSSLIAREAGSIAATVTVTRAGAGGAATSVRGSLPVRVAAGVASTARPGDYSFSSLSIPAGQNTATLIVTPVPNHIAENDTAVEAALQPDADVYNLGTPVSASVTIEDGDVAAVCLSSLSVTVNEVNSVPPAAGTGITASVTAYLQSDPVGDVVLDLLNSRPDKCLVSPSRITLTGGGSGTWQTGLVFKVTALNDYVAAGGASFAVTVQVSASSSDWQAKYRLLPDSALAGTCVDDLSGSVCAPLGTPVAWLTSYALTNAPPATAEIVDADRDGMLAWQEYLAGTVPTNQASMLRMTALSANSVTFGPACTDRIYAVLCSTCLTASASAWLPLAPFCAGTGTVTSLPISNRGTQTFYRIGVRLP